METTGKLTGASRTFDGRGIILTFEVDASAASQIENLQNQDKLKIKAVRYTQKRSLDANAYFHVLVGKIADVLTISKAKAKNVLICKYFLLSVKRTRRIYVGTGNDPCNAGSV